MCRPEKTHTTTKKKERDETTATIGDNVEYGAKEDLQDHIHRLQNIPGIVEITLITAVLASTI